MKEVNYICTNQKLPIAETINDVFQNLKTTGFVPCQDLNTNFGKKEKHIYLDTPNRGPFSRSLNTYGGFCRIVIVYGDNEHDLQYFVDYRSSASSQTKRFAVNRFVTSKEIAEKIGFKNKLVKVFEVECQNYDYYMKKITTKGNVMIKLLLQHVKLNEEEKFSERHFCFFGLKDRTKARFGSNNERNMELEICECFKMFTETVDKSVFTQIFNNKYCALMSVIPEINQGEQKLPF